ncbi:hypothetical protein TRAPUB_11878 [Trametes pubescens]|uniref:Uncharacterized protein n=1 Tax=Trametes pubescens TaxID=154538 RepID=A0A1M2VVH6_TRAPU|nr:hypothetical protein TRAPUB_11878 [Trametes pubescens]
MSLTLDDCTRPRPNLDNSLRWPPLKELYLERITLAFCVQYRIGQVDKVWIPWYLAPCDMRDLQESLPTILRAASPITLALSVAFVSRVLDMLAPTLAALPLRLSSLVIAFTAVSPPFFDDPTSLRARSEDKFEESGGVQLVCERRRMQIARTLSARLVEAMPTLRLLHVLFQRYPAAGEPLAETDLEATGEADTISVALCLPFVSDLWYILQNLRLLLLSDRAAKTSSSKHENRGAGTHTTASITISFSSSPPRPPADSRLNALTTLLRTRCTIAERSIAASITSMAAGTLSRPVVGVSERPCILLRVIHRGNSLEDVTDDEELHLAQPSALMQLTQPRVARGHAQIRALADAKRYKQRSDALDVRAGATARRRS